jgi:hypothetical protein
MALNLLVLHTKNNISIHFNLVRGSQPPKAAETDESVGRIPWYVIEKALPVHLPDDQ